MELCLKNANPSECARRCWHGKLDVVDEGRELRLSTLHKCYFSKIYTALLIEK